MFKNETKNAMMAMAVVAMFMLSACAIAIFPASDAALADENAGGTYHIHMRVGDTFSYAPEANIDDTTFAWTVSGTTPSGMSYNSTAAVAGSTTKLEYTPAAAGNTEVDLLASVTTGSHTQTAHQYINFYVYPKLTITKGSNDITGSHTAGSDASFSAVLNQGITSAKSYTFTLGSNDDAAWTNEVVDQTGKGVSVSVSGKVLTVTAATNVQAGTYVITADAGWTKTTSGSGVNTNIASEDRDFEFILTVSSGFEITSTATPNTVVGKTDSLQITTDADSKDTTVTGYTLTPSTASDKVTNISDTYLSAITINSSSGLVTFPSGSGIDNSLITGDAQSATVKFSVTANGTLDNAGNAAVSATQNIVLTVYRELKFTTTPNIDSNYTSVHVSSNNGLDVLLSTTIEGANKIAYNWGDGTEYVRNITSASNTFFTANHTYATPGTYFIQITASNDFGDTTYIKPYTTGSFIDLSPSASDSTLKVGKITSKVDGDDMTLKANVEVSNPETTTVTYKWFMKEKDATEEVEIDGSDENFVINADKSLTINTKNDDLKKETKFIFKVSATFAGASEPVTKSVSYVYDATPTFLDEHEWVVWVPLIVALAFLAAAVLFIGFNPITIGGAVISAIVWIALFVCRFMGVL